MTGFMRPPILDAERPEPGAIAANLLISHHGADAEIVTISLRDCKALERAAEANPSGMRLSLEPEVAGRLTASGVPLRARSDGGWRVPDGVGVQRVPSKLRCPRRIQ